MTFVTKKARGTGEPRVKCSGAVRGRSLNISAIGMAGVFVTGWDVDTVVSLQFSLRITSKPLEVGAVVRSKVDYRYGFEFVKLDEKQRQLISRTCKVLALLL